MRKSSLLRIRVAQDVRRLSWWSVREPPQSAWENSRSFATPPLVSLRNDALGIGTSAEIPHWWRMGSVFPDLWEVAALQNVSYFLRLPTQLTKLTILISYPDLTLSLLIHSKNRGNEVECMLCHDTISLVCFCLQVARYKKDICEVARALNCPEEDRWKEKGWKDDIEY